ncbi:serine hydrolase domain-containing protein [Parasphingorhabdus cellanae]|uniref:Serine hydrolase n=1 Tax=Parasphingorhabdus cellanae TaxID=2806553 RepID=A0ABX7T754_9SPHN|nr:serine hydrolase [Parasphingorhabdus cellanae]QTD57439.1 serine hydrolase [Parasphingorhabdus cellanae]
MRTIQITIAGALLSSLAACMTPATDAVLERDLAAAAEALQGATVLDVDLFQPTITIGEKCDEQKLPASEAAMSTDLAAAIAQADSYSNAQKGVGLVILKDGKILHESYAGDAGAATSTDSYSMHKSVLALVYGIAIAEGIIGSLDDRAGQYISEWKDDPRGQITLRQLLHMESGLKLYSFADAGERLRELLFAADINAVALDYPLADAPGAEFRYNNVNSQVAGIALQRALQANGYDSYAGYLEQKLWCPVGNDTARLWLDREGGAPHYYSGLFTNPHNWARIGELIRNQGRLHGKQIVPAEWIKAMAQSAPTNPNYGLHVWRGSPYVAKRRYSQQNPLAVTHGAPYLAEDVLFFDGFGGQRVYVVPSSGLTIVRTGQVNFDYDDAKIVNLILDGLSR